MVSIRRHELILLYQIQKDIHTTPLRMEEAKKAAGGGVSHYVTDATRSSRSVTTVTSPQNYDVELPHWPPCTLNMPTRAKTKAEQAQLKSKEH